MSGASFPIITVDDLPASVVFYERLGFARSYAFPAEGPAVFVTLERGGSALGIAARDDAAVADRFSYWVYVDDVDAAFDEMTAAGASPVAEPRSEPWGERVASVRDPDGNVVHLGAPDPLPAP